MTNVSTTMRGVGVIDVVVVVVVINDVVLADLIEKTSLVLLHVKLALQNLICDMNTSKKMELLLDKFFPV